MNFYKKIKYNLILAAKIAIVAFVTLGLGAGINYVLAQQSGGWFPPTVNPPGGQIAPPVNVGDVPQDKTGALVVGSGIDATLWGLVVPDARSGFGIGLTEPQATVHIKKPVGAGPIPTLRVENGSGGGVGQINFDANVTTPQSASFLLDDFGLKFLTGTQPRITISSSNGQVGIGTVSPNAKLHTVGTVRFEGLPIVDPLLQEEVVFISTNGRLTRGAGVYNGTFQYPGGNSINIWSGWINAGFFPKALNLSFISSFPNIYSVPPVTITILSDGTVTYPIIIKDIDEATWPSPRVNIVNLKVERSGNSFRMNITKDHPNLTVNFTAWR